MTNLAAELSNPGRGRVASPWADHEMARGYGVMSCPFASGDHLGLRVFPHTQFGGYTSVWHRDRNGGWRQYVSDAPVEYGCPRQWGPALEHAASASVTVTWDGPMRLRVHMDEPSLDWELEVEASVPLRVLNLLHGRLPLTTWRPRVLVAAREWVARALGLGAVSMSGVLPTDGHLVAVLRRLYWVRRSTAILDGRDLGGLVELPSCPTIAGWPLPRRGVLAVGEAHATPGTAATVG